MNPLSCWVSARPIKTVEQKSGTNENTEQLYEVTNDHESIHCCRFTTRNLSVNRWWLDTSQSCRLQPEKKFSSLFYFRSYDVFPSSRAQLCFELRRREKFHFSPKLLLFNFIFCVSAVHAFANMMDVAVCSHLDCCCCCRCTHKTSPSLSAWELRWGERMVRVLHHHQQTRIEMSSWMSNKF